MAGYLGNTQKISGRYTVDEFTSSGGTTYTLSSAPGAKNNIQVSAGGLVQYPSAYSVSGTTLTLSGVPSGQKVVVRHMGDTIPFPLLDDNVVTNAKLADDAVGLAEMAPGTDGNIITYDASGNPAAVATGTAGQILTSAGAGAPPTFADAAGGGFTLKGSPVATTSGTNIDVSGFPAGISVLVIGFMGVGFAAKAVLNVHLGIASGIVDGGGVYMSGSVQLRESAYPDSVDSTSGFTINEHHSSAAPIHGQMIITRMNASNAWTASYSMYLHTYEVVVGGGYISNLGGEFTQLRLRGGGNTFNAGSVNFAYI